MFLKLKYGYRNFGFSLSRLQDTDSMAAGCCPKSGFSPCTYSTLEVVAEWVPSVELVKGQLEWWARYLRTIELENRNTIYDTWVAKYRQGTPWSEVDGPIASTIATLRFIGGDPVLPHQWNKEVQALNGFHIFLEL